MMLLVVTVETISIPQVEVAIVLLAEKVPE